MPDVAFLPIRANNSDDPESPLKNFLIAARVEGNEDWIWSCKKTATQGDLYLFWFGKPVSTIAGVGICNSDVQEIKNEGADWTDSPKLWMCSFDPLKELKHPVTLDHIKADTVLAEWWKGRPFQGRPKSIKREAAAGLLALILRLNPNLASFLRGCLTTSPASRVTIPDDDDAPPSTVTYTTSRRVRNTEKGDDLKRLYKHVCQVCGYCIRVPRTGGDYAEVHHLRPLGGEHQGLDYWNNMLVLCPNCHAESDALAIAINPKTGRIACFDSQNPKAGNEPRFQGGHKLAAANLDYNWQRFCEAISQGIRETNTR